MFNTIEEWKEYVDPNLRSKFLISNLGRVKSVRSNNPEPLLLKGYKNMNYHAIPTRKLDGKKTLVYVHKLVAQLFVENPNNYTKILFKNYNRSDCKASNLKWASEEEYKKFREQYHRSAYWYNPNHKPNSKLTTTQVMRLRKMINDPNRKTRYKIIAKQFNINIGTLFSIKRGDSWKELD